MKPHQKLEVWKQSFALVKHLYELTAKFPREERFGLISQMRRACTSIPVNIAEGSARRSDRELRQFLYIALGSASELDTLLLLSHELDFISKAELDKLLIDLDSIFKLLLGFINTVKKGTVKPPITSIPISFSLFPVLYFLFPVPYLPTSVKYSANGPSVSAGK